MQNTDNTSILNLIEQAHAKHPDAAIVLDAAQELDLRKAIRNAGGGDLVAMPAGHVAPTFTGRAVLLSGAEIAVVDAPTVGVWNGVTLIAERVVPAALQRAREAAERRLESSKVREATELRETLLGDITAQLRHHAGGDNVPVAVRVAAADALGRIGAALAGR